MMNICGFNGFKQISSLCSYVGLHKESVHTNFDSSIKDFQTIFVKDFLSGNIIISWNYIIMHTGMITFLFVFKSSETQK